MSYTPKNSTEAEEIALRPVRRGATESLLIPRASHMSIGRGGWTIHTLNGGCSLSGYGDPDTDDVCRLAIECGVPTYDTRMVVEPWPFTCMPFLPKTVEVFDEDGKWDHFFSWYDLDVIFTKAKELGAVIHNWNRS